MFSCAIVCTLRFLHVLFFITLVFLFFFLFLFRTPGHGHDPSYTTLGTLSSLNVFVFSKGRDVVPSL